MDIFQRYFIFHNIPSPYPSLAPYQRGDRGGFAGQFGNTVPLLSSTFSLSSFSPLSFSPSPPLRFSSAVNKSNESR